MFGNKELKERVRLLEYENKILTHRLNDLIDQLEDKLPLQDEMPMYPFSRVEKNGIMLPSYEQLKSKYRE